jgi:hypothetical protein
MAVIIPADKWKIFCHKLMIPYTVDAVVPEVTIKV